MHSYAHKLGDIAALGHRRTVGDDRHYGTIAGCPLFRNLGTNAPVTVYTFT
nr:MAG TPA: hypothetical protein [Bacteriophage sp.]